MIRRLHPAVPDVAVALAVAFLTACATSPLGRSQLLLFPDDTIDDMGVAAFREIRQTTPSLKDPDIADYVDCVALAIISGLEGQGARYRWEVVVFDRDEANAFALPGGKIGVYRGLLGVAETPDQLGAVIGHEVAHVLAGHANERVSTNFATSAALDIVAAIGGGTSSSSRRAMAALGLGVQVGVLLPFSREQESEADIVGLDLTARSGFDPREAVTLWRNMAEAGGRSPPEFLSTHPSRNTRIDELEAHMPRALQLYDTAQAAGRDPGCVRPRIDD